ncbi:inactive serine protease PAMR1 isoform X2 [Lampris incognitus]|uniref:inactive serine protease PAMR1 isoform X2 n=1 Tax=Lampris incognitus TaxID=2546036 RepID=UPI0024B59FF5|nr:inactive serine protease PAMR1 isoform X2 [Lampris incognitus]
MSVVTDVLNLITWRVPMSSLWDSKLHCLLFIFCLHVTAWPAEERGNNCPSSEWSSMCRPCCEYHLIKCRCPAQGSQVGYTVPCCRNALDECDPCIIHPGCSLFENCKSCHNGTWQTNDDFFIRGRFCTDCRQGWSGGDCRSCGGVIQRAQGHIALESYPTNARCEWRVQVQQGHSIELRFPMLSLEADHNCHYDYVEVRDGASLSSPVIGRFCGEQVPPLLKSSGNMLHILFVSDGYNNFNGFVFTFQGNSVCSPSPCLHHGTCIMDPLHSFHCVCVAGYTGHRCEKSAPITGTQACEPPEEPANGHFLPVYGVENQLISVNYLCHPPYKLIGSQQRICLTNATWSGSVPTCVKVNRKDKVSRRRCAPLPKVPNGYYKPAAAPAGGDTIEFFCKNSYILSGNHLSTCLLNGSWNSRPPQCVRACQEPKVSDLVKQTVVKPHPLLRERPDLRPRHELYDFLAPNFNPLTLDKQPEREEAALEELSRGFHHLYTSIEYKCASPLYQHNGSPRRTCLKTGRWSGRHVSCSPVCGKVSNFSAQNLTETHWPWHAAVYIRSPSAPGDNAQRDHVLAFSDKQGATEESAFWYLACSGALVTQRAVVVAAHCVAEQDKQHPLNPAHVKVVLGRQYQTSQDQTKDLQRLRVSNILVHPNYYSSLDSDLAVLKLLDKAKISENVLPVCLPKMQGGEITAQEAYVANWMAVYHHEHPTHYLYQGETELVELGDVTHCERQLAQRGIHTGVFTDNVMCVIRKPAGADIPCPTVISGITTIPSVSPSQTPATRLTNNHQAPSTVWELLGLESFSYEQRTCHPETYTGQTRVVNFRDWIEENMK